MPEYSDRSAAERDISLVREQLKDLRDRAEINDGKWMLIRCDDFTSLERDANDVIRHLEDCMEELENVEEAEAA